MNSFQFCCCWLCVKKNKLYHTACGPKICIIFYQLKPILGRIEYIFMFPDFIHTQFMFNEMLSINWNDEMCIRNQSISVEFVKSKHTLNSIVFFLSIVFTIYEFYAKIACGIFNLQTIIYKFQWKEKKFNTKSVKWISKLFVCHIRLFLKFDWMFTCISGIGHQKKYSKSNIYTIYSRQEKTVIMIKYEMKFTSSKYFVHCEEG